MTPSYPCNHPRTDENTYVKLVRAKYGQRKLYPCRYCKTCDRARAKRFRERVPDYNMRYLREWRIRKRLGIDPSACLLARYWSGPKAAIRARAHGDRRITHKEQQK